MVEISCGCKDKWDDVEDRDEYFSFRKDGIWWGNYNPGDAYLKVNYCMFCGKKLVHKQY